MFRLVVAIPGSILSVEHSLEAKTLKAGFVARALAIYRVDEVIVYGDEDATPQDTELLSLLLEYLDSPPHLRRRLYPIREELRYVGILPPLRTPHHMVPEEAREGEILEGLVLYRSGSRCKIYLGRLGVWNLDGCSLRRGERVTVRITDTKARRVTIADWGSIYQGYRVVRVRDLGEVVERASRGGYLLVATSRLGECASLNTVCNILKDASSLGGVMLLFGGPRKGVAGLYDYDYTVNFVPLQGTLTVRTEEALHASLALINAAWELGWCGDSYNPASRGASGDLAGVQ